MLWAGFRLNNTIDEAQAITSLGTASISIWFGLCTNVCETATSRQNIYWVSTCWGSTLCWSLLGIPLPLHAPCTLFNGRPCPICTRKDSWERSLSKSRNSKWRAPGDTGPCHRRIRFLLSSAFLHNLHKDIPAEKKLSTKGTGFLGGGYTAVFAKATRQLFIKRKATWISSTYYLSIEGVVWIFFGGRGTCGQHAKSMEWFVIIIYCDMILQWISHVPDTNELWKCKRPKRGRMPDGGKRKKRAILQIWVEGQVIAIPQIQPQKFRRVKASGSE